MALHRRSWSWRDRKSAREFGNGYHAVGQSKNTGNTGYLTNNGTHSGFVAGEGTLHYITRENCFLRIKFDAALNFLFGIIIFSE